MNYWRWCELLCLYLFLPTLFLLLVADKDTWLMPVLCLFGIVCLLMLLRDNKFKRFRLLNTQRFAFHMRQSLSLFVPGALVVILLLYLAKPDILFAMPRDHQQLWLITLLIYPLISVIPQELIFRTFFFHRYKSIIPSKKGRWLLSTVTFSFAHLVYGNWIAVILSSLGGAIFGYRYMQTRSTLVVVVEHTLYGSFLFTVGLGAYFLTVQLN